MAKILNVEKLVSKFASLTKSKECIQGLSAWIMHHKEFHQEIVQHWLTGISNEFNALTMFYVANDVIQNCGKKRAPQFREAFSHVLEQAVSLEKVKEIKSNVLRMIEIWSQRDLFDKSLLLKLENILNSETPAPVTNNPCEEELSVSEIIENYKLEHLIEPMRKLMSHEKKVEETEEILNLVDEPKFEGTEDVLVRADCEDMLKKNNIYYRLISDCLKMATSELILRNSVLNELHKTNIFYNAQNGDAKKIAYAYQTYWKRLQNMEKHVVEKLAEIPSATSSPSSTIGENFIHSSSSSRMSVTDDDSTSFSHQKENEPSRRSSRRSLSDRLASKVTPDDENSGNFSDSSNIGSPLEDTKPKFSKLAELFNDAVDPPPKQCAEAVTVIESETVRRSISEDNTSSSNAAFLEPQSDVAVKAEGEVSNEQQAQRDAADDIDLLLDEYYDGKGVKSPVGVKRKMSSSVASNIKKLCSSNAAEEAKPAVVSEKAVPDEKQFLPEIKAAVEVAERSKVVAASADSSNEAKPSFEEKLAGMAHFTNFEGLGSFLNSQTMQNALKELSSTAKSERNERKFSLESEDNEDRPSVKSEVNEDKLCLKSEGNKDKLDLKSEGNKHKLGVDSEGNQDKLGVKSEGNKDKLGVKSEGNKDKVGVKSEGNKDKLGVKSEGNENKLSLSSHSDVGNVQRDIKEEESFQFFPQENVELTTSSSFVGSSLLSNLSSGFLRDILGQNQPIKQETDSTQDPLLGQDSTNAPGDQSGLSSPASKPDRSETEEQPEDSPVMVALSTKTSLVSSDKRTDVDESKTGSDNGYTVMCEITPPTDVSGNEIPSTDDAASEQNLISENISDRGDSNGETQPVETDIPPEADAMSVDMDSVSEEKPNLLKTLGCVLECLAKKQYTSLHDEISKRPLIPFETCLIIYHALHQLKLRDASPTPVVPQSNGKSELKGSSVTEISPETSAQDNFEVVDMDCDSDEN